MRTARKLICIFLTALMTAGLVPFALAAVDVAKIAETEAAFRTLQAAIEAASPGQTVELLAEISQETTVEVDRQLTLDLQGHTVTSSVGTAVKVTNGTLTVKDSVGGGGICGSGKVCLEVSGSASLLLVSGTVQCVSGTGDAVAIQNTGSGGISVGNGGIAKAKVYAKTNSQQANKWAYGIYNKREDAGDTATVKIFEGAEITGSAYESGRGCGVYNYHGDIENYGGTVTGEGRYGVFAESGEVRMIAGTVKGTSKTGEGCGIIATQATVSGGTVTGDYAVNGKAQISGGYFNGGHGKLAAGTGLSGGYYTVQPPEDYVADGKAVLDCKEKSGGVTYKYMIGSGETSLTADASNPDSATVNKPFQMKVVLKNNADFPLKGKTVTCGTISGVTDSNGIAKLTFPGESTTGRKSYTVSFEGDGAYEAANCTLNITITEKEPAPAPKTGDSTPVLLLGMLAVLSITGIAVVSRKARKER